MIAAALLAGFLGGRLAWVLLRSTLTSPALRTANVRGALVPTAGGLVVVAAVLMTEAGRVVTGYPPDAGRLALVEATVGFGLLGFVDDVLGGSTDRGFRGHVGALVRGRLTTGALKLFGGLAVALVAVTALHGGAPVATSRSLLDAALVALAANLGNLLDRAPGRVGKVSLGALALLVALTAAEPRLAPAALVVGAAAAILRDDLHERVMLGDTGANALGAALGLAAVAVTGPRGRDVIVLGLGVLNAASEAVSFSRLIAAVAPLRALDEAGRLR